MHCLIESFYRSIVEGTAVPIPYREIVRAATIMDAIFEQVAAVRPSGHRSCGGASTAMADQEAPA
jgi:hypothetical protein